MQSDQFIWEHFKLNTESRLRGFNFFILLSIFADGGVFTALEKSFNPKLLILLGVFTALLAFVFWIMDVRSTRLLKLTIPALKDIESSFQTKCRIFAADAINQGWFFRFTFATRVLLLAQFLFGAGVLCFGIYLSLR